MNESCDTHGWIETTAPSGFCHLTAPSSVVYAFRRSFRAFRLASLFPLGARRPSISMTVGLARCSSRERSPFAGCRFRVTSPDDAIFTTSPSGNSRLAEIGWLLFDPIAAGIQDDWRSTAHRPELCDVIPRADLAGAIESPQLQEIFFTTSFDQTLWTFSRRREDIDDDQAQEFLRSIAWLDPIWFAAYPAL